MRLRKLLERQTIVNIKDKLVIFSYFLYSTISLIIDSTMLSSISFLNRTSGLIKLIIIVLLLIVVAQSRKSFKNWILLAISGVLAFVTYVNSDVNIFLFFFLFLYTSSSVSYFDFVKIDAIFRIILILTVIFLFLSGILPDVVLVRSSGGLRHSLGFSHPNTLGVLFCMISLDVVIILWNSKLKYLILSILTCLILSNFITDSRTPTIIMMLAIFLVPIFKYFQKNSLLLKFKFPLSLSIWILAGLSYLMVTRITPQMTIFSLINSMTSSRLTYYQNVFSDYGISLFGQTIPILSESFAKQYFLRLQFLDSTYLSLLIRYGFFLFIVFSYHLGRLIFNSISQNKIQVFLVILLFLIFGITENIVFKPEFCSICMMGAFLENSNSSVGENLKEG